MSKSKEGRLTSIGNTMTVRKNLPEHKEWLQNHFLRNFVTLSCFMQPGPGGLFTGQPTLYRSIVFFSWTLIHSLSIDHETSSNNHLSRLTTNRHKGIAGQFCPESGIVPTIYRYSSHTFLDFHQVVVRSAHVNASHLLYRLFIVSLIISCETNLAISHFTVFFV